MSTDFIDFSPRHPRHEATDTARLRIELLRRGQAAAEPSDAQLVDLSRGGFQLHTSDLLTPGEELTIRLHGLDSDLQLDLTGVVRWLRPGDDGFSFVGCECDEELDWSVLGELFLNDVLAMD